MSGGGRLGFVLLIGVLRAGIVVGWSVEEKRLPLPRGKQTLLTDEPRIELRDCVFELCEQAESVSVGSNSPRAYRPVLLQMFGEETLEKNGEGWS
jgi:hypothetical protein